MENMRKENIDKKKNVEEKWKINLHVVVKLFLQN